MTAITAMRVFAAEPHPNADALRVYQFGLDAPTITVVANLENVYQVGDVVAVAGVGAVLADGVKISRVRLRGVDSFGMALGKVEDVVGTDLSERFGATREPAPSGDIPVVKWASIELFHNLRRTVDAMASPPPVLYYQAKIKLDGTNGAILVDENGQVTTQSRTQKLSLEDDNFGFAAWVHKNQDKFSQISRVYGRVAIFGEWAGPGINKRAAIAKIDRKVFAVFAIRIMRPNKPDRMIVSPTKIARILPSDMPDVYVLPWYGDHIPFDFNDADQLKVSVEKVNVMVNEVEAEDPWVKEVFGVSGIGEGLVLYPLTGFEADHLGSMDYESYAQWLFKAKGEKHRVVNQKQPVQIDPEVASSIDAFVDLFVTPARCEQGVEQVCGGTIEMHNIGNFIKWVSQDVHKESVAELEASGLTWNQVAKSVGNRARAWFLEAIKI